MRLMKSSQKRPITVERVLYTSCAGLPAVAGLSLLSPLSPLQLSQSRKYKVSQGKGELTRSSSY